MADKDKDPTFDTSGHPDEVVQPVREEPSTAIAEAQMRHEQADSDFATPQEKKQAAVEQAHSLSTRPDGSYAQLHESARPTLAVADDAEVKRLTAEREDAEARLRVQDDASRAAADRAQARPVKATAEPVKATDSKATK